MSGVCELSPPCELAAVVVVEVVVVVLVGLVVVLVVIVVVVVVVAIDIARRPAIDIAHGDQRLTSLTNPGW